MKKSFLNLCVVGLLATGLLLGACGSETSTPTAKPAENAEVDKIVTDLMEKYSIPGLGLALVKEGKVIYTKGYGVRSTQTKAPVTANTQFAIGSITKSFTSLAVLQLVEKGKLNLDTPVVSYLPEAKFSDPQASKITLRHLLSHTSGIPPILESKLLALNLNKEQVLQEIYQAQLANEPGKTYSYSNLGYTLVGYIIEKVGGQKWEEYVRQNIFNPLNMKTATFGIENVQKSADFALPHALDVFKGNQPVPFARWLEMVAPAGNIHANLLEMSEYMRYQLSNKVGDKGLVSDALFKEAQQVQTKDNPFANPNPNTQQIRDKGYGFGWIVGEYNNQPVVAHNGGVDGFYSFLTLLPQSNSGVLILTNMDNQSPLSAVFANVLRISLSRWLMGLEQLPDFAETINKEMGFNLTEFRANLETAKTYKPDLEALKALEGEYIIKGVQQSTFSIKDNRLYATTDGLTIELVPFKKDAFLGNSTGAYGQVFTVRTDVDGTVRFWAAGQVVAERLSKGQKPNTYTDPKGRFTVTIPSVLKTEAQGEQLVLKNETPPGTFILTQSESAEDLAATAGKVVAKLYPNLSKPPVDTRQVPLPDGQVWTQYIYQLSDTEALVVVGIKPKGTAHFIILQAKGTDVQTLVPFFNNLILSYKITG